MVINLTPGLYIKYSYRATLVFDSDYRSYYYIIIEKNISRDSVRPQVQINRC